MNIEALKQVVAGVGLGSQEPTPLPSDPTILTLVVPGGQAAVEAWIKLRDAVEVTRRWPVIYGAAADVKALDEHVRDRGLTAEEILAAVPDRPPLHALAAQELRQSEAMVAYFRSNGTPVPEGIARLVEEQRSRLDRLIVRGSDEDDGVEMPAAEAWTESPEAGPLTAVSAYELIEHAPQEGCLMALLPTTRPADAPAYLRFGGFNYCPPPEIHVAFLLDWGRRFGAVPMCVTRDVIECAVSRPPATPEGAWKLAREQRTYCDDIVSQGTQSVQRLAIELWKSPHWFFWWD